jgi:hypothetical protein
MKLLPVAAAGALLSACASVRVYETPHAMGHVVDASTAAPIAAAVVMFAGQPDTRRVTATDGKFSIEGKYRTIWFTPPAEPYVAPFPPLNVEAPGYLRRSIHVSAQPGTVEKSVTVELSRAQ